MTAPPAVCASPERLRLSLVVATAGPDRPLGRLLASLAEQHRPPDEVIVAVQGDPRHAEEAIRPFRHVLPLRTIHLEGFGLSRARNAALREVTGDVVGFPDDDCTYAPSTLAALEDACRRHPQADVIVGAHVAPDGRRIRPARRTQGSIDRRSVWRDVISFTVFARARLFATVGPFDERLGVGAPTPWQAAEEGEWVLRAILSGARVHCEPAIEVVHPADALSPRKALTYARGWGWVLANYGCYAGTERAHFVLRALVGGATAAVTGDARRAATRWARAAGLCLGMLDGLRRWGGSRQEAK